MKREQGVRMRRTCDVAPTLSCHGYSHSKHNLAVSQTSDGAAACKHAEFQAHDVIC